MGGNAGARAAWGHAGSAGGMGGDAGALAARATAGSAARHLPAMRKRSPLAMAICVLTTSGDVRCLDSISTTVPPVARAERRRPVEHQAGEHRLQSAAPSPCGDVRCWGENGLGELGDGTQTRHDTPTGRRCVGESQPGAITPAPRRTRRAVLGNSAEGEVGIFARCGARKREAVIVSGVDSVTAGANFNCVVMSDASLDTQCLG